MFVGVCVMRMMCDKNYIYCYSNNAEFSWNASDIVLIVIPVDLLDICPHVVLYIFMMLQL